MVDGVVSECVCVAGNIPEDRFVEYFVETLKKEEDGQFDTTVEQFMECAKACREGKLAERKAADAEQAEIMTSLNREKEALEQWVESLSNEVAECEEGTAKMKSSNSELAEELESLKRQLEVEAQRAMELEGDAKLQMEGMRRASLLRAVYHEFDLDGGGDVGEEELMEVGQARRRLGQKSGEWTEANNRTMMQHIGPDEEGIL